MSLLSGTEEYEEFGNLIKIPGQTIQNDVNQLERLVIQHASHYGQYKPIDSKIKTILAKYIKEDGTGDRNFIEAACRDVLGFKCALKEHQNGSQYFKKMTWWDSFVLDISWTRYH